MRQSNKVKFFKLPVLVLIILFMSLLPDVDSVLGFLTGDMGNYHNQASHSLFAGAAAALLFGLILRWWLKGKLLFWFGLLFAAYAVSLFLDMLTVGRGIKLFWPFSDERFLSPVLLFYGLRWSHGLWSITHIWTVVSEIVFWSIVFGLAHWFHKRNRVHPVKNGDDDNHG